MGILPYNQYLNNPNNTYDPTNELNRQLHARQNQLDHLNSKESLTGEQLKRKQDLEQTVSMLTNKIEKFKNPSSKISSPDGVVVSKTPTSSKLYNPTNITLGSSSSKTDSYLKGFFFDARI